MASRLARLLGALGAAVLSLLGVFNAVPIAAALESAPAVTTYGHAWHHNAVAPCTITERGPPKATYNYTNYDTDDSWSPGVSACSGETTTPAICDYDCPALFVSAAPSSDCVLGRSAGGEAGVCIDQRLRVAANTAEASADAALAAGRTTGAAAELTVGGQVFTDVSTGGAPRVLNSSVQEALDGVPMAQRAPWHGACAEMGCLSQALDAGLSPAGGSIRAVAIGTSNPGHGLSKAVCSSCSAVLDGFGVRR